MKSLNTLYRWYGKRTVRIVAGLILLLLVIAITVSNNPDNAATEAEAVVPAVRVAPAASFSSDDTIAILGQVAAVNSAVVQSEAVGRVVAANVKLAQTVSAGSVLVQLENASQRAAVLQAEGVYDAAVAASASGNIGITQAQNDMIAAQNATIKTDHDAFAANENTVLTVVDQLFSNPDSFAPGVRITTSQASFLSNERVAYQAILPEWEQRTGALSPTSDLDAEINNSLNITRRTQTLVRTFLDAITESINRRRDQDLNLTQLQNQFITASQALDTTIFSLEQALTTLQTAKQNLDRAQIGGSNTQNSSADAQIKQALGSLRAAQANLAKTIIRAPISGVVSDSDIKVGEFVTNGQAIATITNENALEIKIFLNERDAAAVTAGDAVTIDDTITGVISAVSPVVDTATGKIEVKVSTDNTTLTNGQTVTVRIATEDDADQTTDAEATSARIVVPIAAVKFTANDGSVFVVIDNKLVQKPVTVGTVSGTQVEITGGISPTDEIVIDARGLVADLDVEIIR